MSAVETAEAPKTAAPVKENLRLQKLREREEGIKRQIAALEARDKKEARKQDTRAKIIVGGAILAHIQLHPDTRGGVIEILKKAVTTERDRELLASKGIL
jgi:hypothetical protein